MTTVIVSRPLLRVEDGVNFQLDLYTVERNDVNLCPKSCATELVPETRARMIALL